MSQEFDGTQPNLALGQFAYATPSGPMNCTGFPRWVFHATEAPRMISSQTDRDALGPEWSDTYIKKDYPKSKFGPNGEYTTVNSPEDEGKLEGGPWSDTPPQPKEGEKYPKRADQRTLQELGEAIRDSRRLSLDYGAINQELDLKADNVAVREISPSEIPRPTVHASETPEQRKRREEQQDATRKQKAEEDEKKKR